MDEPLSNLDAKLRTSTRAEIARLQRELQTTCVYVTHDQVEAMTMATRIAVMSAGKLQQAGTPEEIYDRPANTFVAQFIGTPPMNLFPAEMGRFDGVVAARSAQVHVPLAAGDVASRRVMVGVRPEHLRPQSSPSGAAPTFEASVRAVEMLGSEVVALVEVGGGHCAVRGPRDLALRTGQSVTLTCAPDQIHLFDEASGRRLVRIADQEASANQHRQPVLAGR